MKILCKLLIPLCIISGNATNTFSQKNSSINPGKVARIDSFLNLMANNGLFNGGVLVAENGKVIYRKFAGYYSFEQKTLNASTSQFNLASASKPFTAIAILQLVQKNKLKIDDPISKYLPGFKFTAITIRHLLSHTSGLPLVEDYESVYSKNHPNEVISNDKAYADLVANKDSLQFQPGDKFQYNNTNYFLLAIIIGKISKMSFPKYMKKNIFNPAGMKNTYIRRGGDSNTPRYILPAMYFTQYQNVNSLDKNIFYTYFQLGGLSGPNNVVSTLDDLLKFDNALNKGEIIDLKILNEAFVPQLLNNGKKISLGGARTYGLGWNVMDEPLKDTVVFHDGHIQGITAMIYKNLTKNQTILFYDNTESPSFFQKVGTITRILDDRPLQKISLKKSAVRVFGETLVNKGLETANAKLDELRLDSTNYYFSEMEMNQLGYDLLYRGLSPEYKSLSLEVFKINMNFYPTESNVYDSYGEALLKNGQREEAIKMYRKAIEINPNKESAKKTLEGILK